MLEYNPNTRITAEEALQHPYFTACEPRPSLNIFAHPVSDARMLEPSIPLYTVLLLCLCWAHWLCAEFETMILVWYFSVLTVAVHFHFDPLITKDGLNMTPPMWCSKSVSTPQPVRYFKRTAPDDSQVPQQTRPAHNTTATAPLNLSQRAPRDGTVGSSHVVLPPGMRPSSGHPAGAAGGRKRKAGEQMPPGFR
jgi:serine/threonine protein kinase